MYQKKKHSYCEIKVFLNSGEKPQSQKNVPTTRNRRESPVYNKSYLLYVSTFQSCDRAMPRNSEMLQVNICIYIYIFLTSLKEIMICVFENKHTNNNLDSLYVGSCHEH